MSAFDTYIQAKFHGGTIPGGPTFTVIHDAETPLRVGYADSIAEMFRKGPAAGTSAHAMADPSKAIKQLPDNVVAYAAGPVANTFGWHLEQSGYASFSRADWTSPDGMAQMQRVGACLREIHDTWGIPKRWMTDAQLRAAAKGDRSQGGMTTHQQISRVLGGTTHTDPEDNYPRDLLLPVVLGSSAQEDDMYGPDEKNFVEARLPQIVNQNAYLVNAMQDPNIGVLAQLGRITTTLATQHPDIDEKALAQQVIAGLAPLVTAAVGQAGGLTAEQVRDITEQVVRGVFADAGSTAT